MLFETDVALWHFLIMLNGQPANCGSVNVTVIPSKRMGNGVLSD